MTLTLGICSFAFHRTVASGAMDVGAMFRACRDLGCTQLDPWNAHLLEPSAGVDGLHAGRNPNDARLGVPSAAQVVREVRALAARAENGERGVDLHGWLGQRAYAFPSRRA